MKFIVYKTSTFLDDVLRLKKPCENCKIETVIYHYSEQEQKKEKQYTIDISNIEDLVILSKNLGEEIIVSKNKYYDYPVLEIYDSYRE